MDFANQPVDYASIIGQGQQLAGNPLAQQHTAAETGLLNAQSQEAQAQAAAQQQKQARFTQFQNAIHSYDGSPSAVSKLMAQFPEYADQLKSSWDVQDGAKKQSDLTELGQIYSAASGGNWKLAQTLAHQRADAEKANGYSDPTYDAALGIMDKAADGDETQRKVVLNLIGTHLAAVTGPEHFGSVYGALNGKDGGFTLDAGATRYDGNGQVVAESPYLKGADGTIYERDGAPSTKGGDTSAAGGFDHAVATVLHNEGGYNPSDMNGAPVNFGINAKANAARLKAMGVKDIKDLTPDQAKQIYHDAYWVPSGAADLPANMQTPYFDVYIRNPAFAKKALKDSGGDPAQFMASADAYFGKLAKTPRGQKYAEAWAARDAHNTALATGQQAAPSEAGAPPGFHALVPGKPKEPDAGYIIDPSDPAGQREIPRPGGPKDPSAGGDDILNKYHIAPGETGASVLAKLPSNLSSQVKALAEGRLPVPSSMALAKPYWQTMLQLTSQYDPTFDAATAPARKAAITAFTGMGKGAQLVGSINRVANHMQLLWNESNKLSGPDTGWGPANTALAAMGQSFQPADAKAYDGEVTFVAGELGKLAKAGVVTEGEVNKIIDNLGRKNSLGTRQKAIQSAVGIISGAFDPLKAQYESAFVSGSPRPNIPWVSQKAQSVFKQIGGADLSLTGATANSNAPTGQRSVVRTGRDKTGRRVVQYSDGSISYAN